MTTTTRSRVTTTKSGRDHVLARGFSVESDVVGPIKDTIADVQSVSGIKRVAERACLYGAIGVMAFASIQAMHFGGGGNVRDRLRRHRGDARIDHFRARGRVPVEWEYSAPRTRSCVTRRCIISRSAVFSR